MRPIPELLDADRQPRPMSKRIPSPYIQTQPPVVPRRREPLNLWPFAGALVVLFLCIAAIVGTVTMGRWLWEVL